MGGRTPQGGQGYGGGRPQDGGGQRQWGSQGQGVVTGWAMPDIRTSDIQRAIAEDDPELLVEVAKQHGKDLANAGLTNSQIRAVFGAVRQMEGKWTTRRVGEEREADIRAGRRALLLIKPKLAYQDARQRAQDKRQDAKRPVSILKKVLDPAIDEVGGDPKRFVRFLEYFEALLAYFKESEISQGRGSGSGRAQGGQGGSR